MSFINFIPADFWPWILTAAGAVVAWVVAVLHGRRIERDKQKEQMLDTLRDVRKIERVNKGKSNEDLLDDISRKP